MRGDTANHVQSISTFTGSHSKSRYKEPCGRSSLIEVPRTAWVNSLQVILFTGLCQIQGYLPYSQHIPSTQPLAFTLEGGFS